MNFVLSIYKSLCFYDDVWSSYFMRETEGIYCTQDSQQQNKPFFSDSVRMDMLSIITSIILIIGKTLLAQRE